MNAKSIILETRYQQEKSSPQANIIFVIMAKNKNSHQKLPKLTEPINRSDVVA